MHAVCARVCMPVARRYLPLFVYAHKLFCMLHVDTSIRIDSVAADKWQRCDVGMCSCDMFPNE